MNESYVLSEVSKAQNKAGHTADGRRTAQEALAFAQANGESELGTLLPLVAGFVAVDDIDGARGLLSVVTSESARAEGEKQLIGPEALRLVKEDELEAGLARLSTLNDRGLREAAMNDIVEYLIGVNDLNGATEVIDLFDTSGSGIIRNSALRKLSIGYADAGDLVSASETIETLTSARGRRSALRHLLKLQLQDDDLSAALDTARRVPTFQEIRNEPGWRPSVVREFTVETALYEVAKEQHARGHLLQARGTAMEISDKDLRTLILREITASEVAAMQESEAAEQGADGALQDPSAQNRALEKMAFRKASAGDLDGALEAIHQIRDDASVRINAFDSSMTRSGALSRVAHSLILDGRFDEGVRFLGEALGYIETISDVGQRQKALIEAIEVL